MDRWRAGACRAWVLLCVAALGCGGDGVDAGGASDTHDAAVVGGADGAGGSGPGVQDAGPDGDGGWGGAGGGGDAAGGAGAGGGNIGGGGGDGGAGGEAPSTFELALHYHRADADYDGWQATLSSAALDGEIRVERAGTDAFGAVFPVELPGGAFDVAFRRDGETVDAGTLAVHAQSDGGWHFHGAAGIWHRAPAGLPGAGQVAFYYLRPDRAYDGWGLHVWGDVTGGTPWDAPLAPTGVDPDFGAYWLVDVAEGGDRINVIVHMGDEKDPGPDMGWDIAETGDLTFMASGSTAIRPHPTTGPPRLIDGARAHWIDARTIVSGLPDGAVRYALLGDPDGGIAAAGPSLVGGASVAALQVVADGLDAEQRARWPHLGGWTALRIPDDVDVERLKAALKGELVLAAFPDAAEGTPPSAATRVQIPGVLDDLYAYDGPLGVRWAPGVDGAGRTPEIRLWAPTARAVSLVRFDSDGAEIETLPMDATSGVWSITGEPSWSGGHYLYEMAIYHPASDAVETYRVTDPYAVSLSVDSALTHLVDLEDPATKPPGWDALAKPPLAAPEDVSVYELHIRDFSAWAEDVAPEHRGRYLAFTYDGRPGRPESAGVAHLRALAEAGLSVLHLLPSFDIASIPEEPARRVEIWDAFSALCAANGAVPDEACATHGDTLIVEVLRGFDQTGPEPQTVVGWLRGVDGYNWGYDPWHFNVPEGSYATEPDGAGRIREKRAAIAAIAGLGLRVALDVVYNHTNGAGLSTRAVLDRVVPGYYQRLHPETGRVETSTCCQNTATEHRMMERLMVDSLVLWARHYKVDAFRFDLMGHHMLRNMERARVALDALTVEADGVDGRAIYLYGEGWDFGEVEGNRRGRNASQDNLGGTGIGSFNDRLRDAVRGGAPFDSGVDIVRNQGFVNGRAYDPNTPPAGAGAAARDPAADRAALLDAADLLRLGMAGNLQAFRFVRATGETTSGGTLPFGGGVAGYAADPQETVNYVSKHDNQTLFDNNAYKVPRGTGADALVRMQNLALAVVALGQGVPFFHAGSDLLRSKSLLRNSFDSGDWFNRLDWTMQDNNWRVGLPPAHEDEGNWAVAGPVLADPALAPGPAEIAANAAYFRELLRIRASGPLFRLRTGDDVATRVDFHNTGPDQIGGVVVMSITDGACAGDDLDPDVDAVVVFVNATPEAQSFRLDGAEGFALHPVLAVSSDARSRDSTFAEGTFTVPARTTGVFVQAQGAAPEPGLPCNTR